MVVKHPLTGIVIGRGEAETKQKAEQIAAQQSLKNTFSMK